VIPVLSYGYVTVRFKQVKGRLYQSAQHS